jgi:hypothetical protein
LALSGSFREPFSGFKEILFSDLPALVCQCQLSLCARIAFVSSVHQLREIARVRSVKTILTSVHDHSEAEQDCEGNTKKRGNESVSHGVHPTLGNGAEDRSAEL